MIKSSVLSLFLFSMALAFAAGSLALQLRAGDGPAFDFSNGSVSALKRQFREKNPVVAELNAADLFGPAGAGELIDPQNVLNPYKRSSFADTARLMKAINTCKPNLLAGPELEKARVWIGYRCGLRPSLPAGFFAKTPYMFPTGISFAQLAFASKASPYADPEWMQKHLAAFHALELAKLPAATALDARRRILAELDAESLSRMVRGQEWVAGPAHILVRQAGGLPGSLGAREDSTVDYLVYERAAFDRLLQQKGIVVRPAGAACAYREDGLCWLSAPVRTAVKIRWTAGAWFALTLGLIGFCAHLILKNLRQQKLEGQQKRFALQALTHELRTPLASLMFSSERLMQMFESLPAAAQEPFLLIFDDIQRLARVSKSSQHYLGTTSGSGVVPLNIEQVPSLNGYVTMALQRFEGRFEFVPLEVDQTFHLDRYWFGVCLQNLVQNSCQHGISPIQVKLEARDASFVFSVADAGHLPAATLRELSEPFRKGSESAGLGLGLTIVDTVARAMGARLEVTFNPTKFALWFEDVK